MSYSIAIISKDRHGLLLDVIAQVRKACSGIDIIVVEATDSPEKDHIEGVMYTAVPVKEASFASQRNLAVARCTSTHIVFLDDDVCISEDWFTHLTAAMEEDPEALGAMGAVFPYRPTLIGFCEGLLGHPGGGFKLYHKHPNGIRLNEVATCNTVFRKSVIEEAGGFAVDNRYGAEDTDLSLRLAEMFGRGRLRYAPEALVYHRPRNALRKILPWYIRRGRGDAELIRHHPGHWRYLLRTSILLKIVPVVFLTLFLNAAWLLPVLYALWHGVQMWRYRFAWAYFTHYPFSPIKRLMTFLLFPSVKMTADIMFDTGRIIQFVTKP